MNHTRSPIRTVSAALLALGVAVVFGGCTTTPWDNGSYNSSPPVQTRNAPAGFYRVNPGDTLPGIASAFGRSPQDIATYNGLPVNAAVVPGQLLRVAPAMTGLSQAPAPATTMPVPSMNPAPQVNPAMGAQPAQQITLIWPLRGPVLKRFSPGQSKGIVIGGHPGDPVRAAAAGRVVYAGTGIEAYGPLIIIKHDDSLITAYGQNGTLLVKEGDAVAQGQTIGEVGATPSIQFEVRKDGQPADPLQYLPKNGG